MLRRHCSPRLANTTGIATFGWMRSCLRRSKTAPGNIRTRARYVHRAHIPATSSTCLIDRQSPADLPHAAQYANGISFFVPIVLRSQYTSLDAGRSAFAQPFKALHPSRGLLYRPAKSRTAETTTGMFGPGLVAPGLLWFQHHGNAYPPIKENKRATCIQSARLTNFVPRSREKKGLTKPNPAWRDREQSAQLKRYNLALTPGHQTRTYGPQRPPPTCRDSRKLPQSVAAAGAQTQRQREHPQKTPTRDAGDGEYMGQESKHHHANRKPERECEQHPDGCFCCRAAAKACRRARPTLQQASHRESKALTRKQHFRASPPSSHFQKHVSANLRRGSLNCDYFSSTSNFTSTPNNPLVQVTAAVRSVSGAAAEPLQ